METNYPSEATDKDIEALSRAAKRYAKAALSTNTQRGYRADFEDFVFWCRRVRRSSLPASPETVALYLTKMSQHLRASSLKRRVTSISRAHELAKFQSPTIDTKVKTVLRGILRTIGEAQAHASPTLLSHIQRMVDVMPPTLKGLRDRALLLLGFAGGFRRSELVSLDVEDLELADEGIVVTLKRSKTDQTGRGRKIPISYGQNPSLCPVKSIQNWLYESQTSSGALFRPINKWGQLSSSRITDQSVRLILRESLMRASVPIKGFSGHSLRAGFVTVSFINGATEAEVQRTTGHVNQNILRRYHRDANLFRNTASRKLGL